jgi:hypothetical protein
MAKHVENRADYDAVQAAIARGMNTSDVEDALRELGYPVRLDTVDFGQFGTITLEGGENETSCIVTLRVVSVQLGYDTTKVNHRGDTNE